MRIRIRTFPSTASTWPAFKSPLPQLIMLPIYGRPRNLPLMHWTPSGSSQWERDLAATDSHQLTKLTLEALASAASTP
jgi:hypothetical protein